jgi:hypothetical protein
MPEMNVADLTSAIIGPLDIGGAGPRDDARPPADQQVAVATFNVENLASADRQSNYDDLAALIVNNLQSPHIIGVGEVQTTSRRRHR